jgi:hypothetical protein
LSSGKYVASFVVDPTGELVPSELSPQALDSRKVVVVIDEPSKRIYLWLGKGSSLNNKMGARRIVKSIPIFGLRKEGAEFPLGRDCKIIEIEESLIGSDNAIRVNMQEFDALLRKPHIMHGAGIWHLEDVPPPAKDEIKTEAKILERRMQFEMSHLERETIAKTKKEKQGENGK